MILSATPLLRWVRHRGRVVALADLGVPGRGNRPARSWASVVTFRGESPDVERLDRADHPARASAQGAGIPGQAHAVAGSPEYVSVQVTGRRCGYRRNRCRLDPNSDRHVAAGRIVPARSGRSGDRFAARTTCVWVTTLSSSLDSSTAPAGVHAQPQRVGRPAADKRVDVGVDVGRSARGQCGPRSCRWRWGGTRGTRYTRPTGWRPT